MSHDETPVPTLAEVAGLDPHAVNIAETAATLYRTGSSFGASCVLATYTADGLNDFTTYDEALAEYRDRAVELACAAAAVAGQVLNGADGPGTGRWALDAVGVGELIIEDGVPAHMLAAMRGTIAAANGEHTYSRDVFCALRDSTSGDELLGAVSEIVRLIASVREQTDEDGNAS